MQAALAWLAANPLALIFTVVLGAVLLGKAPLRACGLGVAGSAIVVGAALSAFSASQDVRLAVDPATRALFLSLLMYGLGLRFGASLGGALQGEGLRFTALAVVSSAAGLACAWAAATALGLPPGAVAGVLAGAMTFTAAVGAAEQAIQQGLFAVPAGATAEEVGDMVALAFALTYVIGALGFALLSRWLAAWWNTDLGSAAREHEEALGVPHIDAAGITSLRPLAVRAFRLSNDALAGWTVGQFQRKHPRCKVLNVLRSEPARREPVIVGSAVALEREPLGLAGAGALGVTRLREAHTASTGRARTEPVGPRESSYMKLGAADELALRPGDILTLGGPARELQESAAAIGPDVDDPSALNVPLDHAEIVVENAALVGRELAELRVADFAGQVAVHHMERGGVPIPLGLHVKLRRRDVLFATGVASAVDKLASLAGRVARPSAPADLLLLSAGLVLGLLIGSLSLPVGPGAAVGLGAAGGLLVAGLLVARLAAPLHLFAATPKSARGLLEDLGLAAFAAIVAIDAGTALASINHGGIVGGLVVAGVVTCVVPPIVAWAVGHHIFRMNPAILAGVIAGARSQEPCACEASARVGSNVPWIGFPVAYAVSGILLTLFGYVAMALS